MKKITFAQVLKDGFFIGIKNFFSLLGAVVLYVLTIWVPYINVGTTIAMYTIPVELSKGSVINPLFIFDKKYRRIMPEFFTLVGIQFVAEIVAMIFLFVPYLILSLAWSQSVYLMLDKKLTPADSLVKSNEITYGYKWTMFFVQLCLVVAGSIIGAIVSYFDTTAGSVVNGIVTLLIFPIFLGCEAVIYKGLSDENTPEQLEAAPEFEAVAE